ncbi:Peptidyl-prolyl cis-trans isomerase [Cronobacter universalis NCTC 9529]|nr:Peptidyl-prolyl cis-trans isomerase [Cronobacter universalis NCTC 9529]
MSFAFHEFEECAAASGDVGDLVGDAEHIDSRQGVAAACNGERVAFCDSASHDFGAFTEVRELEHAHRTVPQDSFRVFQDFSQFLSGNIAHIQNLLFIFDVSNRFQSSRRGFRELGRHANVSRDRDITGGQQTFRFINQIRFVQRFTDVVALSCHEGVGDAAAHDQLVSDFRQGIQYGQFGRNFRATHDSDHRASRFFQRFTQRVQFFCQQRACARHVSEFRHTVSGRLRAVRGTKGVHYEHVAQGRVFFRERLVVFLLAFVKANVFQHHQLAFSYFDAVEVVFRQANRGVEFVFQVVNYRQQREFFVVFAFGRAAQVGRHHHFSALFQSQFDGRQGGADTRVRGNFALFYRNVEIGADQNAFTCQIQIGHLNYRHGESSR